MVFDAELSRERLIDELQELGASVDEVSWLTDPSSDVTVLGRAIAVSWWNGVLGNLDGRCTLSEALFDLAANAYLERWRLEVERQELFDEAYALARAAQAHLSRQY